MPKILHIPRCSNTSKESRSACCRAQFSQPQRRRLHRMARNIMYFVYVSTCSSDQNFAMAPITAFAAASLRPISKSSRKEKDTHNPKYLNWGQKVTNPSSTRIGSVSASWLYSVSSLLHFVPCDSLAVRLTTVSSLSSR